MENIYWTTLTEINNKGFEIEKSSDGIHFDSIGFNTSKSFAGKGADYSFTDFSPYAGKNYYRLKQIDFYNNAKYSDVKVIETRKTNSFKIFPNPNPASA